eukprot:TRINITY_DN514402_c0_g1_i1.p1 TRINITY_DN514402_c0_g1~~TRINITY_DN514402_c0_g1_i1.p1  ORF type:complete len:335 (-),score=62.10 TRINITY_DN514402_c0_g1_i1:209-1213(-)
MGACLQKQVVHDQERTKDKGQDLQAAHRVAVEETISIMSDPSSQTVSVPNDFGEYHEMKHEERFFHRIRLTPEMLSWAEQNDPAFKPLVFFNWKPVMGNIKFQWTNFFKKLDSMINRLLEEVEFFKHTTDQTAIMEKCELIRNDFLKDEMKADAFFMPMIRSALKAEGGDGTFRAEEFNQHVHDFCEWVKRLHSETQVVFWARSLHQVGVDVDFLKDLLQEMTSEVHAHITLLNDGICASNSQSEIESMRHAAHSIKGVMANLWIVMVSRSAEQLEFFLRFMEDKAAKSDCITKDDIGLFNDLMKEFNDNYGDFLEEMQRLGLAENHMQMKHDS